MERFWKKVDIKSEDECWGWKSSIGRKGRGIFWLNSKFRSAPRLSWEFINGEIKDNMFVLHKCDNPNCVNPNHLFLGTHSDNMKDMRIKGRNAKLKLSDNDVLEIRALIKENIMSIKEIASEFNVNPSAISNIKHMRTRKYVSDKLQEC